MSRGTEMGFDLDSIITTAKKADNILGNMVEKTIQIKKHMHEAFSLKGDATATQYIKGLKEMMSLSQKISDTKLTMDVDSSALKGAKDALGLIVEDVRFLSKEGIGIFDTKGLYATNQGILTTEDNLSSIRERMAELRKEWSEMVNTPYQETPFSPPLYQPKINEKTGKPYGENTKAQKENFALFQEQLKQLEIIHNKREQLNAKDHEREKHRKTLEIELEMRALVELEAKAKKELSWAKMTQDEKAAYIKKRMDEVLKVEQKNIAQIQSEYKKLWGDLKTFSGSRGAIEKAAEGKTLTPEQQKEYDALISLEQETESKIQRMYSKHQDILSDITVKEVAKRSKLIADELKKQKIDAPTALSMASSARTGSQMEKAKQAVQDALMEVDKDDIDTINNLNKAYLNLRASIEKLTKAQKNEQTLQPTVRNEYRRVLKELEELDKAKKKLQSTDAYRGTLGGKAKMEADDTMNALLAREQDLKNKRAKYREEAGNLLDEVEREHAARQAQISVQEFEKAQKELEAKRAKYGTVSTSKAGSVIGESENTENVRQAEKAIKDLIEVRDKLDKKDAKYEETVKSLNKEIKRQEDYIESVTNAERHRARLEREKGETFQGAMDYSKQAKSVNDLKKAMDFLEKARRKEDLSTKKGKNNYKQLTKELERQSQRYTELTNSVSKNHSRLLNLGEQLKRSIALVFSVSQIRGYVNNLMQIRGEFEMQHRSLQILLKDEDKANEIWDKTVNLAVKSPFRVKELVTYTKQLAAYKVEADKLYETNKMLADVSAGLGVDMNRLILAFGQVKAANYLRGTELRQFSEAGVNILEELSKRFTELEGRVVSVGDVFERVSKRMVSFSDVEAVFQSVTGEGGTFYRMQEKQSETLRGMMMNLRDSIDLMFNDMGMATDSSLKSAVRLVKELVDNWRKFIPVITAAGTAFMVNFSVKNIMGIGSAFSKLWKIIAKNPIAMVTSLVASLIVGIISVRKNIDDLIAVMRQVDVEVGRQLEESISLYRKLAEEVRDVTLSEKDRESALNKLQSRFDEILPNQLLELEYIENISDNYNEATEAMLNYYNSKAVEQKKDRINAQYVEELEGTDVPELISSIKKVVMGMGSRGLIDERSKVKMLSGISGVINAVVKDVKDGKIDASYETLQKEIYNRIFQFSGINFKGILENYLGVNRLKLMEDIRDISKTLQEEQTAYDNIQGLPSETYSESEANKVYLSQKEHLEKTTELFREASNIINKYSTEKNVDWSKVQNEVDDILKKLPAQAMAYKGVLRTAFTQMVTTAQEGSFEFKSSIHTIKQSFINAISSIFKDQALFTGVISDDIKKVLSNLIDNFQESLDKEVQNLNLSDFQQRVIEIFDEVADIFEGVDNDLFANFIPDSNKSRTELIEDLKSLEKQYMDTIAAWNATLASGVSINVAEQLHGVSEEYIQQIAKDILALAEAAKRLGFIEEKKGGRSSNTIEERIRVIDQMNAKYKELNRTLDEAKSLQGAFEAYQDAFATAYGREDVRQMSAEQFAKNVLNFPNEDDVIEWLDNLANSVSDKKDKIKVELAKGKFEMDIEVRDKKDIDKELLDDIQELFDQYDLSLELKKLNIPPDLAKRLFDVDYLDLKGLKKAVQEQEAEFIGRDMEDEYKNLLEKIDDMEDKAAKERMKTYVKYLMEGMSERVRLKIEELRKLKEIEESEEYTPEQKERIKEGVSKEARVEKQKQEWEDFQGSDMYIMMFEDLEHYGTGVIDILYTKLSKLKESLSELPASEVKEIVGQIEKLENIKIERNPFESWKLYAQEIKKIGLSEEELQMLLIDLQKEEEEAQEIIDIYNLVKQSLTSEDKGVFDELDSETLYQWAELLRLADEMGISVDDLVNSKKESVIQSKRDQKQVTENLSLYKGLSKSQQKAYEKTQEWLSQVGNVFGASAELMETLGVESDSVAMTIANTGSSMVSLISSAVQFTLQLQLMGVAANSALGIIGYIAIAIQAVATVLTAIFSAKDKALQKQVEDNLEKVERLQKTYEDLEESIDNAWDTASIQAYNQELKATTQSMINAQKAAIAAQEKRKGANQEGSDAYNELQEMKAELDELEAQLEDSLANSFSKVTDGILDSVHDAARDFTDAWWDAFIETGDGLKGLEENFNEMFLNLAKNQAALQITGAFADKWKKDLEKYINEEDTELTKEEAQKWAEEVRRTFPELSSALEGYLGVFKDMASETQSAGLSALSKSIQGVSEETAQVIEALLSSMRFYVADSNQELKNQTRYMRDMYNLLNGMTMAHSQGGRGIKVVM